MKLTLTACALALLAVAAPDYAQLLAAKDAPVAYGHHHLNVTGIPAAQKFLADTLVILRQQKPTAGTKGSSMDHHGTSAPRRTRAAAGYSVAALNYPAPIRLEAA